MEHALKKFRTDANMTLAKFGEQVGASKGFLSRIENGRQRPSIDLIERIIAATAGAVRADDFLSGANQTREAAQ